jgi:hypothetical protein
MEAVFRAGSRGIIPLSSGSEYCFRFPSISRAVLAETVIFPQLSGWFLTRAANRSLFFGLIWPATSI